MNAEEKLASIFQQKKTAPFLFIGSGFTRHYLDSPTWLEILEKFAPKHINSYISSIGETNLPKIAQIVGKEINDHFWALPTNDPFKQKIQDKITTPTAVLRYQIAEELKKLDINNIDSKYNDEIKLLQHINIDGIITTNWDDILEQLFPKYMKLVGQEDLLTMHSYCIGEIYKIHGCIHQPATMILTDEDYSNFSKKNTYLAAKLITIFLEHPIIFLGYSISDPNIQDILKSIIVCLSSKKLNDLKNNLFFVEWNPSPDTPMNIYNHEFQNNGVIIPTTRIVTHDYTPIYRAINSFEREIPAPVLRHYKKQFYQIVYAEKPEKAIIRYSGVTGYGEKLIQTALNVDLNEIETIAHYTAAKQFMPNVTSIVDIGGQDMKYIRMKNGAIDNIMLNEACSSGCGSFIETFAKSLNLSIEEFVNSALEARRPVDLGSRCTVFMNSKIKQAQKEGYSVGDISAGLSYSVIKNAIQKVMKVRDVETLGNHIVVQGGTFYNDAVLRAFELIVGKNVVRPDISGLMGAYGMALLSKEQYEANLDMEHTSTILKTDELDKLEIKVTHARCNNCENHCKLTINKFSNGQIHVSGNRCEKGAGVVTKAKKLPNLVQYKFERIFNYQPLEEQFAPRGTIGIPRVLNMYEDYPFWFTFLTSLGFRVILSEKTTRKTYEKGMESMPSESVCYPAKLSHGHIESLIEQGVKTIFYPCIPYSRKEYEKADNHYNCPIVISYSEVLKNNVEELKNPDIKFINSFLPFEKKNLVKKILELDEFKEYKFTKAELNEAVDKAEAEYQKCKKDIRDKGAETVRYIEENNLKGIVLAGRPYHIDPEINHGIDTLITSLGLCVLTEDSVSDKTEAKRPLRVVDQWVYHARLYAAADFVGKHDCLELVQLNSFGCGVDAVTTDQVEEILSSFDKMYTLIKIDEVNNLGAVRIRIRSLLASMKKREQEKKQVKSDGDYGVKKKIFTKEMRKDYTILIPQMAPIHFELLEAAVRASGYHVELLRECTQKTVETGLKYVNNDACYPSILVTGQMIEALQSGKYDLNKTALIMSQTGGGCRATNYIGFIRKALKDAGFENVPVISFNIVGMEKMPGFKLTIPLVERLLKMVVYGDLLQKMLTKNRAYEVNKGETQKLFDTWLEKCKKLLEKSNSKEFKQSIYDIVNDFEKIELDTSVKKPKVGIVGEVLIKYHPFGNNYVADILEKEGAEVILPDFMGFAKFMCTHKITFNSLLNTNKTSSKIMKTAIKLIDLLEKDVKIALANSKKGYLQPCDIWHLEDKVKNVLSIGNQTGEGWFLTAEMIEYIENDIPNIICVQPFACLPNHVVGKGVIKTIRSLYPEANISPVDYDPGASEANQTNRIKLLMTVAKDNLKAKENAKKAIEKENSTDAKKEEIKINN